MKAYLKFAAMVIVTIVIVKLALRYIPMGDKILMFL